MQQNYGKRYKREFKTIKSVIGKTIILHTIKNPLPAVIAWNLSINKFIFLSKLNSISLLDVCLLKFRSKS